METIDWSQFNEQDVREEIITPLLHALGYRTGTEHSITREQYLKYDKFFLGHKKPSKDWTLTGRADYLCEAGKRVRWTIEAKSPSEDVSIDDIQQAYTYAKHPEIRAVYFCLCNGKEIKIFNTNNAPDADPILVIKYEEYFSGPVLHNLLSPSRILHDHPNILADYGSPLGPGLKSLVRIIGGKIVIKTSEPYIPAFSGYTISVTDGFAQRIDSHLVVAFTTRSPFEKIQKLNERLGIVKFDIASTDTVVSVDKDKPTEFLSEQSVLLPQGEEIYNFMTGQEIRIPINLTCKVKTVALGVLDGSKFVGQFFVNYSYIEAKQETTVAGEFTLDLS